MNDAAPRPALLARVFVRIAPRLMPRAFTAEFGAEWAETFVRQHLAARRERRTARFWWREARGLSGMILRTRRSGPHRPLRRPDMLHNLRQDIVFALRTIWKTPVVAGIAALSLGFGVAANTTIFSVVHSWLLRPLPYADADRLVMVFGNFRNNRDDTEGVSAGDFFDWRAESTTLDQWVAQNFRRVNLTGLDRPEELIITEVTPNFFTHLGATPLLGRTFADGEGAAGNDRVVVLGERLWRNRFGADPALLGRAIRLNGESYDVIGIMPETFDFILGGVSAWVPTDLEDQRDNRRQHQYTVTARLRPGRTLEQARAEIAAFATRLETAYPETNADWGVNLQTLRQQFPGPTDRGLIQLLMAVVAMVLIIACANIANLLMAKTDARQREIAIRMAMGAGKARVVQQLLTESVVLATVGGVLGLVISVFGIRGLQAAIPDPMPLTFFPAFDGPVLAFGLLVSFAAGLTFGIAPASQAIRGDFRGPLLEGGRGGTAGRARKRLRSAFVVTEFALALTILVGAAALTDVFQRRIQIEPGFDSTDVLTLAVNLPAYKYPDNPTVTAFIDELERAAAGVPGSEAYAVMNVLPRTVSLPFTTFAVDGRTYEANQSPRTSWLAVSANYFETMRIAVRQGRTFTPADRDDAPPVVLVNQRMVDLHFPDVEPIGRRIDVLGTTREIVGVVDNVAQERLTGLQPQYEAVYFPLAQYPVRSLRLAFRAAADPIALTEPAQAAVWAIDPDQPISAVQTLEDHIRTVLAGPSILGDILMIVGLLALGLSAIGIYGVMAYTVSQQTNEIGIRMALGAKPGQVLTRVGMQGATLAGIGLVLGVPAAFLVVRIVTRVLSAGAAEGFEVQNGVAAAPLLVVSAILVGVGMLAVYLPARRATKVDPASALVV